jgi:hypothetical protein
VKSIKKVITVFLSIIMCLIGIPFSSVYAETESDTYGNLTYEIIKNEVVITDCVTSVVDVEIPSKIEGYPVLYIGDHAFEECTSLKSVKIPNSVINIGDYAFYKCYSLKTTTIPDSILRIGKKAFDSTGIYTNQYSDLVYLDNWLIAYKGTSNNNTSIKI